MLFAVLFDLSDFGMMALLSITAKPDDSSDRLCCHELMYGLGLKFVGAGGFPRHMLISFYASNCLD